MTPVTKKILQGVWLAGFFSACLLSLMLGVSHLFVLFGFSVVILFALFRGRALATHRDQDPKRFWALIVLMTVVAIISIVQTVEWYHDGMPIPANQFFHSTAIQMGARA